MEQFASCGELRIYFGGDSATRYGALHGTIASGRVRLVTVGGAKIAR